MFRTGQAVKKYRLSKWLESLTALVGISAVNLIFFRSDPGFLEVAPHPYWIVVLLAASRYGFGAGVFSGIVSGLLYFFFSLINLTDISFYTLRDLSLWGKPVLFFIVGAVLGEIRQMQIRDYGDLAEERDSFRNAFEKIKTKYEALSEAKQEIDTRIISQEQTLGTLYEAAQGLRSLSKDNIYPAVLEILREFLSVEDCSIYLLEGDRFKIHTAIRHGGPGLPEYMDSSEGMMGLALEKRRAVSIKEVEGTQYIHSGIIISAPIFVDKGRQVIGVLNVEKMPFLKFTSDSPRVLGLVADWCGTSIENATIYQETRDKLIADEIIEAYTYDYFKRRLREEFVRATRYQLDLSLIVIDFPGLGDASDEGREDVLMAFSMILKNQVREIDILFLNNRPGSFLMLLPTTPPAGARVVVKNLMKAFNALSLMAFETDENLVEVKTGVGGFSLEMKDPEELVKQAEEDLVSVLYAG